MALVMKYFVLKPRANTRDDAYAKASQVAMAHYAVQIQSVDPKLANDLWRWVDRERTRQEAMYESPGAEK